MVKQGTRGKGKCGEARGMGKCGEARGKVQGEMSGGKEQVARGKVGRNDQCGTGARMCGTGQSFKTLLSNLFLSTLRDTHFAPLCLPSYYTLLPRHHTLLSYLITNLFPPPTHLSHLQHSNTLLPHHINTYSTC